MPHALSLFTAAALIPLLLRSPARDRFRDGPRVVADVLEDDLLTGLARDSFEDQSRVESETDVQNAIRACPVRHEPALGEPGDRHPADRTDVESAVHSGERLDRKSTRLNSSHLGISYSVFCLKKV